MPTTTANLGLTLPTPNVDTGWGGTLNSDFTIIDNLFAGAGTGTSVGLNVGSAKTLTLGGTMILGSGDGTAGAAAPVSIRGAAKAGTNLTGFDLVIDAPNGTGTGGSGGLVFRTAPAGISSTSPNTMQSSMVITSAGNVGIGTSSPAGKLHVNSSSGAGVSLISAPAGSTAWLGLLGNGSSFLSGDFDILHDGTQAGLVMRANLPMTFGTNNTERMRIDSSGNVGIGTGSPAAKLDISGNILFSAANPQIQFNAGGPIIRLPTGNTLAFLSDSINERMRIDSSGNVGIGTSSPAAKLNVYGDTILQTSSGSSLYLRNLSSENRIDSYNWPITASYPLSILASTLTFYTSDVERMRIASNGAIGLSGANYGTAGQVLTSNGSGGSPSWQNAGVSQGTVQTFAASGNSFTGIPSTVKTIVINIAGWDPSADAYIRIGTSSGFNTTSYVSSGSILSASGTSTQSDTGGFLININANSVVGYGSIRLTNLHANYWVCDYTIGSSGNLVMVGGGGLGLSGVLDRVQIIPKTGSFAASGVVNINYF